MLKFTVAGIETSTSRSLTTAVLKPVSEAVIEYRPGFNDWTE